MRRIRRALGELGADQLAALVPVVLDGGLRLVRRRGGRVHATIVGDAAEQAFRALPVDLRTSIEVTATGGFLHGWPVLCPRCDEPVRGGKCTVMGRNGLEVVRECAESTSR